MAASLLLCLGLGNQYLSTWQYDQVTVAGERRVVKLQDGSEMIMSGDTAIDVRFEAGSRRIDLARGQGLFRVAHDQRRPFVVYADGYSVRDIGTVFNVAHHADGVRVVVVEGAVEAASGEQRALLRAGQGLNIAPEGLGKVQPVDAALATAWSGGRLVVQNQSLAQILEALKPHYSGRIFLLNKEAGARRLSVVIDLKRVDDWLTGLSKTKAVQMKRIGNVVILT
jgi:transmembrane sensor